MKAFLHAHAVNPWSSNYSIGSILNSWGFVVSAPTAAVYPSANLAIYIPFRSRFPFLCANAFFYNGALGTAGNVDVGFYSKDGRRIWSTGSTGQSGANALQTVNITDVYLGAGMYYLAIACDNGAADLFSSTFSNSSLDTVAGIKQQASAFPLPTTATFADCSFSYVPIFGFTPRSVV